jgi:hypothetical protein
MRSGTSQLVERCLQEAIAAADSDRRMLLRRPFFRPVTIMTGVGPGTQLSAFSRDISPGGIGLLHDTPIDAGCVELSIPSKAGRLLLAGVEIRWCAPIGDEWHLSGGRFLGSPVRQATALLSAVVEAAYRRRVQQRHPFFRPITITMGAGKGQRVSAFSRDISARGIGLLHSAPLNTGRAILSIPSSSVHQLDISTEIRWCDPVGQGWYLSGGRFATVLLDDVPARLL